MNNIEKRYLINQTSFVLPLVGFLFAECAAKILQYRLKKLDNNITVNIEARILNPKISFKSESLELILNIFKRITFPALGIQLLRKYGNKVDSFDLPDIYTTKEAIAAVSNNGHHNKTSNILWSIVNVDTISNLQRTLQEIFKISESKNQELIYFHWTSLELEKLFSIQGFFSIEELNDLAATNNKNLIIGIEIDNFLHNPQYFIRDVKYFSDISTNCNNLKIGVDIDFFHLHESFCRWYPEYSANTSRRMGYWESFLSELNESGILIVDYHLHDGVWQKNFHTDQGELSSLWPELKAILNKLNIEPIHRNFELMPSALIKLLLHPKLAEV